MRFQDAVEKLIASGCNTKMFRQVWVKLKVSYDEEYRKLIMNDTNGCEFIPDLTSILATDWIVEEQVENELYSALAEAIKMAACLQDGWTGGPGDYSPPHCSCEKCVTQGKAFRYSTGTFKIDSNLFRYFWNLLAPDSKQRRFGLEFEIFGKCRITLQDRGNIMCVDTNKEQIRIGKYILDIKSKTFTKARASND